MLTTQCIHPQIMATLAHCGHGSKILIADGNYPVKEKSGDAEKVYLGLSRGIPTATDVLSALHTVVEFESATVMTPNEGPEPEVFEEFRKELNGMSLSTLDRYAFYEACMEQGAVALAISTGEQRTFSCILLTIACA
ncbi:MAG: RbsD/FucU family protein [Eubacteriales bacterium]|nr:RbsD/FucU family protein [Eubacteriales bacterium]